MYTFLSLIENSLPVQLGLYNENFNNYKRFWTMKGKNQVKFLKNNSGV